MGATEGSPDGDKGEGVDDWGRVEFWQFPCLPGRQPEPALPAFLQEQFLQVPDLLQRQMAVK